MSENNFYCLHSNVVKCQSQCAGCAVELPGEICAPIPHTHVGEAGGKEKCLCIEKAGDHAGCNFPNCDRYAADKDLPVEEGAQDSKMSNELAGMSDVAAIEYGQSNGQTVCREELDYDNSADLTKGFSKGQSWMYQIMQQELSTLRTQLEESRHDTAVYKEWWEKGKADLAVMTEERDA